MITIAFKVAVVTRHPHHVIAVVPMIFIVTAPAAITVIAIVTIIAVIAITAATPPHSLTWCGMAGLLFSITWMPSNILCRSRTK